VEEVRDPAPARACRTVESGFRKLRLAQPLDEQSARGDLLDIGLERYVPAHEAHREAVALERRVGAPFVEV